MRRRAYASGLGRVLTWLNAYLLAKITHFEDVCLAEEGIIVKLDLGVADNDLPVRRLSERVDLNHRCCNE